MEQALKNRVCMVTDATNGIGKATAQGLAAMGGEVVVVGRTVEKAEQAATDIRAATGNQAVSALAADFESLDEVRALAKTFLEKHDKLHVLVNNAGMMAMERRKTRDGFEIQFGVNHLATFLLTNLLLDLLRKSAPARIITLSSQFHRKGEIDFSALTPQNSGGDYKGLKVYGNTKLANVLFANELARRLVGAGVTSNSLHPGAVNTGIMAHEKGVMAFLMRAMGPLMLTPEKGAATSLYLATSPEVATTTGQYFEKCKVAPTCAAAHDEEIAAKLWAVSETLTGLDNDPQS